MSRSILILSCVLICVLIQHFKRVDHCEMAKMFHKSINSQQLLPSKLSTRLHNQYMECEEQKQKNQIGAAIVLGCLAFMVSGPIGAAFAGPTLFGAAATSHGLAVLGGGSLAAGGFGMAGGTFLISTSGCILGKSLVDLGQCAPNPIGVHQDFYFHESGKQAFSGFIQIIGNPIKNIMFLNGTLFDSNGEILYDGKFVNNVPMSC